MGFDIKGVDPQALIVQACPCGWEYPRNLFMARARPRGVEVPGLSSEDLQTLLEREPLVVFFICPVCSTECFTPISRMKPGQGRVLPVG